MPGKGSSGGNGTLGKSSHNPPSAGPQVRYDQGPTRRLAPQKSLDPRMPNTSPPTLAPKSRNGSSEPRGAGKGAVKGVQPSGKPTNWRDVRRSDPEGAREILVGTKLAGRGLDVGVGVATGFIGGVSASGYRGGLHHDNSWVHDPWGWNHSSSFGFYWGSSCGWGSAWFPWYWSWYYPCWWWYSRPYYYNDYCFYRPVSTVVYSQPQVIYLERESEPVGEAVVSLPPAQPAGTIAPPTAAESTLSIAAQRYLELGDRAFREGRYTDAVQFYAKAVEFAPGQGALYLVLSDALFASGDYHYGAYAVRRALELDPDLVQSQIDKHGFYPDPQQFDAQLASLESYLNEHTTDRDARLVLALNYLFGARAKDALRVLESAASAMADDQAAQKILTRAREVARD